MNKHFLPFIAFVLVLLAGCAQPLGIEVDPNDPEQIEAYCGKDMLFCDRECTPHSEENCGSCGNDCGEHQCIDKRCMCTPELHLCDEECVDVQMHPEHCGACHVACAALLGVEKGICDEAACKITCKEGFADCDGLWENGCEVHTDTDPMQCGGCAGDVGIVCEDKRSCVKGECNACEQGFVWISAGTAKVGSPKGEFSRKEYETSFELELKDNYCVQMQEFSQELFYELLGYRPEMILERVAPVASVSWHEAANAANALSKSAKLPLCYACEGNRKDAICQEAADFSECKGYRLPTELEWEYFARAGSTGTFYNGNAEDEVSSATLLEAIAWYAANAASTKQFSMEKTPNAWGLYDMIGNVAEWCHDEFERQRKLHAELLYIAPSATDSQRTLKGGGFNSLAGDCRLARRMGQGARMRSQAVGFRVVRYADE